MVTSFTEKKTIGDLIRHEYNPLMGYTRKKVRVYNKSGSTVTVSDMMGYPILNNSATTGTYKLAFYGDEANVLGLIVTPNTSGAIANNAYVDVVALVRGPAIINDAQLPTVDVAASPGTFVQATLIATLQALNPPILCNPENPTVATQTT